MVGTDHVSDVSSTTKHTWVRFGISFLRGRCLVSWACINGSKSMQHVPRNQETRRGIALSLLGAGFWQHKPFSGRTCNSYIFGGLFIAQVEFSSYAR